MKRGGPSKKDRKKRDSNKTESRGSEGKFLGTGERIGNRMTRVSIQNGGVKWVTGGKEKLAKL